MNDTLLIEVRTEELPPAAVALLARRFPKELADALIGRGFADDGCAYSKNLATPRRFAAIINGVCAQTKTQKIKRRGPQLKDCYDDNGKPQAALRGFMRAVGESDAAKLKQESENGRDYVLWNGTKAGINIGEVLAKMARKIANARYRRFARYALECGRLKTAFVRPVRGLIMLLGKRHYCRQRKTRLM